MLKQLFVVILLTTLSACGGGSDGTSDTNSGGNTGSGNNSGAGTGGNTGSGNNSGAGTGGNTGTGNETGDSVRINNLRANLKYKIKYTAYSNGVASPAPDAVVEVLAVSDTSLTTTLDFENSNKLLTQTVHYTIDGDYRNETMTYVEETNTAGGVVLTQTSYFDPYRRFPHGRVRKNQQWIDTFNGQDDLILNGVQQPQRNNSVTELKKILGVNVSKTVEAGEFNTYIFSVEGGSTKQIYWIDQETSVEVYTEAYSSGKLYYKGELVEIN